MSIVKTDLLQNRLGTSHPAVTKGEFVKAWGNANQVGTTSIRFSFGVSSLTDAAVGITYFNLTSPMQSTTFGTVSASSGTLMPACPNSFQNATTTDITCYSVAGAPTDAVYINIAVLGNLA